MAATGVAGRDLPSDTGRRVADDLGCAGGGLRVALIASGKSMPEVGAAYFRAHVLAESQPRADAHSVGGDVNMVIVVGRDRAAVFHEPPALARAIH